MGETLKPGLWESNALLPTADANTAACSALTPVTEPTAISLLPNHLLSEWGRRNRPGKSRHRHRECRAWELAVVGSGVDKQLGTRSYRSSQAWLGRAEAERSPLVMGVIATISGQPIN